MKSFFKTILTISAAAVIAYAAYSEVKKKYDVVNTNSEIELVSKTRDHKVNIDKNTSRISINTIDEKLSAGYTPRTKDVDVKTVQDNSKISGRYNHPNRSVQGSFSVGKWGIETEVDRLYSGAKKDHSKEGFINRHLAKTYITYKDKKFPIYNRKWFA